jgi:hypothetical protein
MTRREILVKPTAPSTQYSPEPTIDQETYQNILETLHDLGVNMERLPRIYSGKGEEDLRDLFVMHLAPHFQSVTGETFNAAGKTDILIRHERTNVFVAECKFWKGIKGFLGAIDQALSYLTWRDSKAAILCFVRNEELGPVLEAIAKDTKTHPCFVKDRGIVKQGWFLFEFRLPQDATRPVHLAFLCFHLPEAGAVRRS